MTLRKSSSNVTSFSLRWNCLICKTAARQMLALCSSHIRWKKHVMPIQMQAMKSARKCTTGRKKSALYLSVVRAIVVQRSTMPFKPSQTASLMALERARRPHARRSFSPVNSDAPLKSKKRICRSSCNLPTSSPDTSTPARKLSPAMPLAKRNG